MELSNLISNWSKAQKAGAVLPCPRCGKDMADELSHNAMSRRADIFVCSTCGMEEALCDMGHRTDKLEEWFISRAILKNPDVRKSDSTYKIRVQKDIILKNEDIDDIMCTALEGGITYWCCKAEVIEDKYFGEYASDQISRGGSLRLYDAEEDEIYDLTLEKFLKGFALACEIGAADNEGWFHDDGSVDAGMIDANGADVIIQYALFGEIVFG